MSQISTMVSNTPCVDGYVTISAESLSLCFSALALRSATSTLPSASHCTATMRMPHMAADAGLVPCADTGIKRPLALAVGRLVGADGAEARILADAPLLGWSDMPGKPVSSHRMASSEAMSSA